MPIYEYKCKHCNKSFEELIRGNEEVGCPTCGDYDVDRKLSVCGFATSSGFVGSTNSGCSGCNKNNCKGCPS